MTILMTEYALSRVLKDFAIRMGLSDTFADTLAQVYTQTSPIAERWTKFMYENCSECSMDPASCPFLNPVHVSGDVPPANVKAAVAIMIENDQVQTCPARKPG